MAAVQGRTIIHLEKEPVLIVRLWTIVVVITCWSLFVEIYYNSLDPESDEGPERSKSDVDVSVVSTCIKIRKMYFLQKNNWTHQIFVNIFVSCLQFWEKKTIDLLIFSIRSWILYQSRLFIILSIPFLFYFTWLLDHAAKLCVAISTNLYTRKCNFWRKKLSQKRDILKILLQKGHTIVKRPQIDQTTRDKLTEPVAASTLKKGYDADNPGPEQ